MCVAVATHSPVKCSGRIKEPLFTKVVPAGTPILALPPHTHTDKCKHEHRDIYMHLQHTHTFIHTQLVGRQTSTHYTHSSLTNHSILLEGGSCTEVNIWLWDVNAGLCKSDMHAQTHTHTHGSLCNSDIVTSFLWGDDV